MDKTNYVKRFSSWAKSYSLRIFHKKLPIILFLMILTLFPPKGFSQSQGFSENQCDGSGDIPFIASNSAPVSQCIRCNGPWSRISGVKIIFNEVNDCTWYAANKGIFSPFGEWICTLGPTDGNSNEVKATCLNSAATPDVTLAFCLRGNDTTVNFTIEPSPDGKGVDFFVDKPPPACSSSVSSFLGDNFNQEKSRRDSDTFLFTGMAGDEVRLRLEANPQDGNNGGEASLGISGNFLDDEISGALPLEITVMIPANGEYSAIVEQPKNPAGQRFRGSYILRIEASTGSIDLIEPSNSVEK
ncbi:MAG: hypothetical protein L0Y68_04085 [Candidatus Dadabacteria bacterium]|nr:hypothetical protein [Candidatus Dadabacteria bacterium]